MYIRIYLDNATQQYAYIYIYTRFYINQYRDQRRLYIPFSTRLQFKADILNELYII